MLVILINIVNYLVINKLFYHLHPSCLLVITGAEELTGNNLQLETGRFESATKLEVKENGVNVQLASQLTFPSVWLLIDLPRL